ncbi:MAG: UDP-N-acetylmuramoyl-L-alanine--D-glutamate ligase [Actinomycetota bacterium]|nr:UDP-N-acetylmuramoyl-L-alanine--D-glutamate ligase [Actinomycetota bacterium]
MSGAFDGERAVVVGAAVAGIAVARALAEEGATVRVTERRPEGEVEASTELHSLGIELLAGGHEPAHLDGATLVVTAPGVPEGEPVLGWARSRGIPVWGEMELGARLCRIPYVAVTGTNGKTTTTAMIEACLRAAGIDAVACGNIGRPFVTAAREHHDALVVECSSFQLQTQSSLHPVVSVLLNVAPDHLDWHGSEDAYIAAKAKIFAVQSSGDTHVGNRDDFASAELSMTAPCDRIWFGLGEPSQGEVGYEGEELVARLGEEARLGVVEDERAAYRADAAAAAAASLAFGVGPDAVALGLAGFRPARHRGEVSVIVDGVRFMDDSKATNVHAALAAIDGVRDAVLIAGGRAKGVDLSPLRTRAVRLKSVVAIGEAADELVRVFDGAVPIRVVASIEAAVEVAFASAGPNGTVLLAPACASWDQFSDYEERGDRFTAAARALTQRVTHDRS